LKITLFDNPTVVWRALPEEPQRISAYTLYFYKLNKNIDLHSGADSIGLALFKFKIFLVGPENYSIAARVTFRPFKVVQGRW